MQATRTGLIADMLLKSGSEVNCDDGSAVIRQCHVGASFIDARLLRCLPEMLRITLQAGSSTADRPAGGDSAAPTRAAT